MPACNHPSAQNLYDCELPRHVSNGGPVHLIRTRDIYQTEPDEDLSGYSERILGLVASCDNAGIPAGCNAESAVGVSKHGERAIQLFLRVEESDGAEVVREAGFRCRGEVATIACATRIASMVKGMTLDQALSITAHDVRRDLGEMLPDRGNRPYIAVEAVRAAIGDYYLRRGVTLAELDRRVHCDEMGVACLLCEHCSLRDARVALRFS